MITAIARAWAAQFWPVGMQLTFLIILVYAISFCFRRFPARCRYLLWLLVLIRLAIPTAIRSPWGIGQYLEHFFVGALQWVLGSGARTPYAQSTAKMAVETQYWLGMDNSALLLWLAWLSGIFSFSTLIVARSVRFCHKAQGLLPVVRPDVVSMVHRMTARLGLRSKIRLLQADGASDIAFPLVHGLVRPMIILPAGMAAGWTASDLEPVVLHELIHVKRRDCLVNLVQMAVQVLYFYHPMVWLANRAIRQERELACDDDVVRLCGGCPTGYVHSLVQAAEGAVCQKRQRLLGIAMAERFSNLGRRIHRMMHPSYNANDRYGFITLWAVIVLGLFCVGVSCSKRENSEIFAVGNGVTAPVPLAQPLPSYTDEARTARAEGIVLLQAVVRKDGTVSRIKVLKGVGYGLDESAVNTLATKWRFKPGTRKGIPVDVQANIEVNFKLY